MANPIRGDRESSPSKILVSIGSGRGGGGLFVLSVTDEAICAEFMLTELFCIPKSDIRSIRKHDCYWYGYWLESEEKIWMGKKRLYVSEACVLYQAPGFRQKMLRSILLRHGYEIDSYYDNLWI